MRSVLRRLLWLWRKEHSRRHRIRDKKSFILSNVARCLGMTVDSRTVSRRPAEPTSHRGRASASPGPNSGRSRRPPSLPRNAAASQGSRAPSHGAVFAERDRTIRSSSMKLKAALRQIDPDNDNLFHGRLSFHLVLMTPPIWHIAMPSGGGVHSINIESRLTAGLVALPSAPRGSCRCSSWPWTASG